MVLGKDCRLKGVGKEEAKDPRDRGRDATGALTSLGSQSVIRTPRERDGQNPT